MLAVFKRDNKCQNEMKLNKNIKERERERKLGRYAAFESKQLRTI